MVPNVLDRTVEEAAVLPEISGIFTLKEMGTVFSEEYEAGTIAKQKPDAGEFRKGDNTVIEVWNE